MNTDQAFVVEHQLPYGTVIRRTSHTSAVEALRRYRECLKTEGSVVFILRDGKELQVGDLRGHVV